MTTSDTWGESTRRHATYQESRYQTWTLPDQQKSWHAYGLAADGRQSGVRVPLPYAPSTHGGRHHDAGSHGHGHHHGASHGGSRVSHASPAAHVSHDSPGDSLQGGPPGDSPQGGPPPGAYCDVVAVACCLLARVLSRVCGCVPVCAPVTYGPALCPVFCRDKPGLADPAPGDHAHGCSDAAYPSLFLKACVSCICRIPLPPL